MDHRGRRSSIRTHGRVAFATAAVFASLLSGLTVPIASAAPGEDDTPIRNPDLRTACGIDILMILDESGSIGNAGATGAVKAAFRAFTRALNNTGSRLAVAEFSTVARLPLAGAAARNYTTVTDATLASTFDPYIAGFNPNGSTNWEDGFRVGRYFLPRPSPDTPHLTVFITDGDPNLIIRQDRVTFDPGNPIEAQNQYERQVPLLSTPANVNQTQSASENPAKNRAVPNANALKAQKSHVLSIAVGNGLQNPASLSRIIAVSGPDVFPDTGPFNIATTDVYREPNFALLEAALREAAFQLCAPSVNVRKLIDHNPDPAVDDLQPAQDWSMSALAVPEPDTWVAPVGATGNTATGPTGPDGFVNFQWTTAAPVDSTVTVSEVVQPGYTYDRTATTCTYRTPDAPTDRPLPDFVTTTTGFRGTVPDDAIVTCTIVNRIPPAPAVHLEKSTNGDDADTPTGPFVPIGSPVNWSYEVTNTGNVPLTSIAVTDDKGVTVSCPAGSLAPGAVRTCTATGTSVAGQYANVGTVTARGAGPSGTVTVTDTDPSHYFGAAPGIDIEKATNGNDADLAPGPFIPVGDPVTWTYVVTNTGNAPLTGATVTDDVIGPISCPAAIDPLAVGEIVTCTAPTGAAAAGQYKNNASVTATSPTGVVQDSDASHYFGEDPDIDIEKFTNGVDADAAPGPVIAVGQPVAWTYEITNTGNVPLTWSVTDDQLPALECPRLLIIVPGETISCSGPVGATAQPGQYANLGTVDGVSPSGEVVTDTDPSHYFGAVGGIDIEKFTNGVDVVQPPGPFLVPGSTVTWTYVVTNTGNIPLVNVTVDDHQTVLRGISTLCPQTTLAVGESMTCSATGSADPDQYSNLATATGTTIVGQPVQDVDPSAYFGSVPGIDLQKLTNGDDADEAPGPFIPVGAPVNWTYVVTNSGNASLSGIVVTDDQGVAVTCPATTLAAGADMTCTGTGTSAAGQYANVGSASGVGPAGQAVSDTDPSHYFGTVSAIDIEKSTNGQDADTAPGVLVPVGDPVTWTYAVTNPGNVPIKTLTVTDDQGVVPSFVGGDADSDTELDPGETWTYEAAATAVAGQYTNVATVDGFDVLEEPVTDTDPSNYFGFDAEITIEKTPDQASVNLGDPHTFTITVTNTGTADLTDVTVTDPVTPACDRVIGDLMAGASTSYTCDVAEVLAPIDNVATVVGTAPGGGTVSDDDHAQVTPIPSILGDVVWRDDNRNARQDAGEPGIAGARVDVTDLVRGGTVTASTNGTGHYRVDLRPGSYRAALDMTSVGSTLTTPGSYDITLAGGEENLTADFGVFEESATAPDTATIAAAIGTLIKTPAGLGVVALVVLTTIGLVVLGVAAWFRRRRIRAESSG